MRGPKPPPIELSETERQELEQFTRRHSTPQQLALRARSVLAAATGANNMLSHSIGVILVIPQFDRHHVYAACAVVARCASYVTGLI